MFNVGDRVAWTTETSPHRLVGTVVGVFVSDRGLAGSTLYDVAFHFGLRAIPGSQLKPVAISVSLCEVGEQLFITYKTAVDGYSRLVSELIDAAGLLAHFEFEFLREKVAVAQDLVRSAGDRFKNHRAEHGC